MKEKNISLRSLDRDPNFGYSSKTVERALKKEVASLGLVIALEKKLGVMIWGRSL